MTFKGEMMLLGWAESSARGRTVTFLLDETEDEHPFKQYTIKSGKRAGQRFAAMLVPIGDDEQPAPEEPHPSQIAAVLCKDPQFHRWADERGFQRVTNEETARAYICDTLEIQSRRELDSNPQLAEQFQRKILFPFNEYRHNVNNPL